MPGETLALPPLEEYLRRLLDNMLGTHDHEWDVVDVWRPEGNQPVHPRVSTLPTTFALVTCKICHLPETTELEGIWTLEQVRGQSLSVLPDRDRLPGATMENTMDEYDGTTEFDEKRRDAALDFLAALGFNPNPDAVGQLAGPFAAALEIICTRGYTDAGQDPDETPFWLARGWKGLVHDILDNALRLKHFSWKQNKFYPNGALDMMNFAGFYLRAGKKHTRWGEIGEPG